MSVDGVRRHPAVRWLRQGGYLPVGFGLALVVLWALGSPVLQGLRYERVALANGEWWRFLSGNLVHASFSHLMLNLAGLAVVVALFPGEYSRLGWFLIGLASAVAIGVGLWWLKPQVDWYVGLSGVLHGVLAAGALAWWRSQSPLLAALLTAALVLKLAWEQWQGALGWSGDLPVIVDAHVLGAIGGGLAAAALLLFRAQVRPS